MAARTPRRSFATPFVVTLAAAPAACYVQSTGPTAPPPSQPPAQTTQTEPAQPATPPSHPPIITNPPMPQQNPPPSPTPSSQEMAWTIFKAKDGCEAAVKAECPPKAMCNPPPPFKYACPENASLDKPLSVVSHDGGASCMLEFPMPTCPPNTACNPPRPRPVSCPKR